MTKVRLQGPVQYRAWCGNTVTDHREGDKGKRLGPVLKGWTGDERCEDPDLRADREVPAMCQGCPKLHRHSLDLYHEETHTFFSVSVLNCRTYTAIEGATAPEASQADGQLPDVVAPTTAR